MHIPDGFLSTNTWVATWVFSAGGLGFCIKKTKEILKDKMVPLMGVMSAFIFAAQMLNFPVIGGTSGHLLGGVLAAALLGPWAGAIVIACVLAVQCLIFQDGGLTALGANIFNMSIIGTIGGYFVYRLIAKAVGGDKGVMAGVAIAAWLSVVIASSACAIELALSGTSPLQVALPAMAGVHALIGIGEAIISCLVIGFVIKARPDLVYNYEEE
ncbi:MAG: energy-coupling factor ABC transporter permease [Candidatus Omnitrophica bacterium]|nr:energy-coupling factor ABC transporter permease [Candidatus Omnitrophota bacterium]MDD5355287.1 energy-coupling factor ABC transporter permease [Candidatus Omnitrophota bacterium]